MTTCQDFTVLGEGPSFLGHLLVGAFNKEKTLVGVFSRHCETLRRFNDRFNDTSSDNNLPHVAGFRGTTGCRWPARGALPRAGAGWPWPSPAASTPPPTPPPQRSCATRPPGQQSSSSSATWTSARRGEPRLELSSNLHEFHSVRWGPVLHRVLIDSLMRKRK